jgi:glycosyltransferase involved in cell wall biosynthesis
MKILIVENGFSDLKKSRIPLGKYFQSLGNEVYYACPDAKEKGIHSISMSRNSLAPIQLFHGCVRLNNIELEHSIESVLSFRFIPNVLNYLASFRNRGVKRVAVITGLGYAFISTSNSLSAVFQRILIRLFYRIASNRIQIIAQNPDDLSELGVINGDVILGSGIKSIVTTPENDFHSDHIKLVYVGRLLRSKGILTAIEIFEILKSRSTSVSLTIAGTLDVDNPDSISEAELMLLRNKKGVNYLGFVNNIDSVYKECNVLLFLSNYREGVPRVILESLKNGLTIVTKDMPGCKETVRGNGFLLGDNGSVLEVVNYISGLNMKKLLENRRRSVDLFNDKFSAEVIYPQYLEKLR